MYQQRCTSSIYEQYLCDLNKENQQIQLKFTRTQSKNKLKPTQKLQIDERLHSRSFESTGRQDSASNPFDRIRLKQSNSKLKFESSTDISRYDDSKEETNLMQRRRYHHHKDLKIEMDKIDSLMDMSTPLFQSSHHNKNKTDHEINALNFILNNFVPAQSRTDNQDSEIDVRDSLGGTASFKFNNDQDSYDIESTRKQLFVESSRRPSCMEDSFQAPSRQIKRSNLYPEEKWIAESRQQLEYKKILLILDKKDTQMEFSIQNKSDIISNSFSSKDYSVRVDNNVYKIDEDSYKIRNPQKYDKDTQTSFRESRKQLIDRLSQPKYIKKK